MLKSKYLITGLAVIGTTYMFSRPVTIFANDVPTTGIAGTKHERTFMAIKPDAVQRGNIGEIIGRMEKKGFKLVGLKLVQPSKQLIEAHYADLSGRPFFNGLVEYMTGKPVVAMVWEGKGVVAYSRVMIGATNPLASAPGTIRGDLAIDVGINTIHGSDSTQTAEQEISLWFKPDEIANYNMDIAKWIYEK
ncbi:hypothetical protein ABK040_012240 [Willaertia magna]